MGHAGLAGQSVVAKTGSNCLRWFARRSLPHTQRTWPGDLRHHGHLCVDRLDNVPRARVVLDYLPAALRHRTIALGAGIFNRSFHVARRSSAVRPRSDNATAARSRKLAPRLHHAVGVPVLFAVHDHLERKSTRRNILVYAPLAWRLAIPRAAAH